MKVMRTTVATVVAATLSMSAFSVFAEASLTGAIETSKARSESLIGALQGFLDIVTANRAELVPEQIEHSKEQGAKEQPAEQSTEELPEIDVSADLLQ